MRLRRCAPEQGEFVITCSVRITEEDRGGDPSVQLALGRVNRLRGLTDPIEGVPRVGDKDWTENLRLGTKRYHLLRVFPTIEGHLCVLASVEASRRLTTLEDGIYLGVVPRVSENPTSQECVDLLKNVAHSYAPWLHDYMMEVWYRHLDEKLFD